MDKLAPLFDRIGVLEGCDPKVSVVALLGALAVASFSLKVSVQTKKMIYIYFSSLLSVCFEEINIDR